MTDLLAPRSSDARGLLRTDPQVREDPRPAANRRAARIVGALFIVATATSLVSTSLAGGTANATEHLLSVPGSGHQVMVGSMFQLAAAFASAGIAIWLYPVLRPHREALALAAVAFRTIEAMLYITGVVALLSLLTLNGEYGQAGLAGGPGLQTLRSLLPALRDWTSVLAVIAFGVGALMYYTVLFQTQLIPRWLSVWGLLGATLAIAGGLAVLFGLTSFFSTAQIVLSLPIGVQEMVLAVWLIARGFTPRPGPARDGSGARAPGRDAERT